MSEIRLAVVGTGFFSQYHYEAWSRIAEVKIEALVYASNAERAADVAARYGIGRVYDDAERMIAEVAPDLIDIVSPPDTHLPLVELAVRHRTPAITQKPLSDTFESAQSMSDIAVGGDTLVVAHENWRFKPWFREARRLLDDGFVGQAYSLTFRMRPGDGQGPSAYLDRQPYFQQMPRFLIHETGVHLIDVFRFLFGEVSAVTARLRRLNPAIAGEDSGLVLFDFQSGAAGLYDGNRLADFEADNTRLTMGEMLIEGSDGQIKLDGFGRLHVRGIGERFRPHPYDWQDRNYGGDCVYALQRHVVDHLLRGTPVENRVSEYLRNLVVEQAIYESHSEARRVGIGADVKAAA